MEVHILEVPSLPYLGSLLPFHSNTPPIDPKTFYTFYPQLRKTFGDFYKFGLPGIGKGPEGSIYVLQDPHEMMKLLRNQDESSIPYPRGLIEAKWPLIEYLQKRNATLVQPIDPNNEPSWDGKGYYSMEEAKNGSESAVFCKTLGCFCKTLGFNEVMTK
jgi:hypothetical protein